MKIWLRLIISTLSITAILSTMIAAPALAWLISVNNDSFTTPKNTTMATFKPGWVGIDPGLQILASTSDQVGNIFLVSNDNRMRVFDSTGTLTTTWSTGQFSIAASDLEYDYSGHLYVSSNADGKLYRYLLDGTLDTSWLGTGMMTDADGIHQIALDSERNLYVPESSTNSVKKFSSTGVLISTLTNGLSNPSAIAISPNGKVYVGNGAAVNVYSSVGFGADSPPILTIGPSLIGGTNIANVIAMAVDSSNTMYYIGDGSSRWLIEIADDGSLSSLLTISSSAGQFWIDAHDARYYSESGAGTTIYRDGVNVLSNDVGSVLTTTVSSSTTTAGGTVSMATDGSFTYTPLTGFVGTDTFVYTATDGSASASATVSIAVTAGVPDAPTIGAVTSVTSSSATVSWTAPASDGGSTITSYTVTPSPACAVCTGLTVTGSPAVSPATLVGLSPGATYTFAVTATNLAGTGSASSASASITTDAVVPGAPTSLAGTDGNGQVSLSWSAPTSTGGAAISDYLVESSSDGGSTWSTFVDGTSSLISATVTGLTNGTVYTFRVSAINSVGTGIASATATATPTATVPGAPTSLAGTSGDTQVALSWSAPSSTGGAVISDYKVESSSDGGSTWSTFTHTASTATSATVTGLTNGTVYTFRVSAINSAGTGTASATAVSTPVAPPPPPSVSVPGVPNGFAGTAGDGQAALSWSAPTNTGGAAITGYTVTASPGTASCVSVSTSCTIVGLINGTGYRFSIHATNSAGDSVESALSASVTPEAAASSAPSNPPSGVSGCPAGTSTAFTDIDGSFASADIGCIEALEITTGTSATTYSPDEVVSREQMAAFLARTWRSLGGTCQSGVVTPFTDIAGSFAESDIGCIWALGVTTGTSATTFDPTAAVTREQMAAFLARLWRALGRTFPADISTPFTDIYGSFAQIDIGCIKSLGITRGTSHSTYSPTDAVTREQMAAFLARTIRRFAA